MNYFWHATCLILSKRTSKVDSVETLIITIMKKLLIAVLLLGGLTAQANQVTTLDQNDRGTRYNTSNSVTITERGIQYTIYKNGNFDHSPVRNQVQTQGRRTTAVRTAPGQTYGVTYESSARQTVKYNRNGQLIKVGNTLINYNRQGQVKKIGTTSVRYTNGRLTQVGNKKVHYNRRGKITSVSVNTRR